MYSSMVEDARLLSIVLSLASFFLTRLLLCTKVSERRPAASARN